MEYRMEILLEEILQTLKEMKQQEFDYWEAWKKAKTQEQDRQFNKDYDLP